MAKPEVPRDPREVLDETKRKEVLAILSNGGSRRAAARYVGCSPGTLTRTVLRDPDFAAEMSRAEERLEILAAATIRRAAQKDQYWRAAAWILERKNSQEFGPRRPGTFTGAQVCELITQMAEIVKAEVPEEHWGRIAARLHRLLAELRGEDPPEDEEQAEKRPAEAQPAPDADPPMLEQE